MAGPGLSCCAVRQRINRFGQDGLKPGADRGMEAGLEFWIRNKVEPSAHGCRVFVVSLLLGCPGVLPGLDQFVLELAGLGFQGFHPGPVALPVLLYLLEVSLEIGVRMSR